MAGIFAGWVVALTHLSHLRLALTSVVSVLAFSLLISLMTGPGFYLRDLALVAAIALSPFIGRVWVGEKKTWTQRSQVLGERRKA